MRPQNFFVFRAVLITVFVIIYSYICHQLLRIAEFNLYIQLLIMAFLLSLVGMILYFPLFYWFSDNRGRQNKVIVRAAHLAQNYMSYILFFVVVRDFLAFLGALFSEYWFFYSQQETVLILLMPIIFMLFGRLPFVFGPFVKTTRLHLKKGNLKIAQISDLHIGEGTTKKYIQKVVEKVNSINADVVVLTGDIIDHDVKIYEEEISLLKTINSKHAVVYILGNHEYYWNAKASAKAIEQLGIRVLQNENIKIQIEGKEVVICGVTDPAAKHFSLEVPDFKKTLFGTQDGGLKILLAHQSFLADEASKHDFDLQLSGHTHGGQFIPWSLLIRFFQKYAKGLYKIDSMFLYVNQGTGHWGPKDRFGTYPEISEIILH